MMTILHLRDVLDNCPLELLELFDSLLRHWSGKELVSYAF